jgi:hypothetical protein
MSHALLFLFLFFQAAQVEYKPKDEFEVKLNYEFKQRQNTVDRTKVVDYTETRADREKANGSGGPLPYLTLNIRLIKLPNGEMKIKGLNHMGKNVLNKKVVEGTIVQLVLGFTDDLKDRINSHEYNLYLIDGNKKEVNRIHLLIGEDGTFSINGEKRGKF